MRSSFVAGLLAILVSAPATGAPIADNYPVPSPRLDPSIVAALAKVSALRLRSNDERLVAFGTRNLFSETSTDPKRGVYPARDWLAAQFRQIGATSGGRLEVALDTYVQPKVEPKPKATDASGFIKADTEAALTVGTPRAVEVSSVIATLKGDDPSRGTIVLSSHYDSRNSDGNDATLDSPGADDNGSAVVAVLEAARILAPLHFPATIVFACFDGEEQGLYGSDHYAKTLKDAGRVVEANLNNDIIGASTGDAGERTPYDVRLFSEALPAGADLKQVNRDGRENDSPARELARAVKSIGEAYVPHMHVHLIYRTDRLHRGGDQQSFAKQGYPAVRFVEQHENFVHQHQNVRVEGGVQYGDLIAYVDFAYVARVTQLNIAALANLALAPPAPKAGLDNRELSNDTTLQWKPVAGAARYEVLWRRTTDATWNHARPAGNATSFLMKGVDRDGWVFGVRAIDAYGHASPAAYMAPFG